MLMGIATDEPELTDDQSDFENPYDFVFREYNERFIAEIVKRLNNVSGDSRQTVTEKLFTEKFGDTASDRTSITIEFYAWYLAGASEELLTLSDTKDQSSAFNIDRQGKIDTGIFQLLREKKYLEIGHWFFSIDAMPCFLSVRKSSKHSFFEITYQKKNEEKLLPILKKLNEYIETYRFFKGKNIVVRSSLVEELPVPRVLDSDVILSSELKTKIYDNTVRHIHELKLLEDASLPTGRGIILSGPPGCGKTLTCRSIVSQLPKDTTTIWVTPSSVQYDEDIEFIFELSRNFSPCVIIFEDIDCIGGDREGGKISSTLGELLTQMDGLYTRKGVVVIATTNYITSIDSALRDRPKRFDRHFLITYPESNERKQLLQKLIDNPNIPLEGISQALEGKSCAFIEESIYTARIYCLRTAAPLTEKIIIDSIKEVTEHSISGKPPEGLYQ